MKTSGSSLLRLVAEGLRRQPAYLLVFGLAALFVLNGLGTTVYGAAAQDIRFAIVGGISFLVALFAAVAVVWIVERRAHGKDSQEPANTSAVPVHRFPDRVSYMNEILSALQRASNDVLFTTKSMAQPDQPVQSEINQAARDFSSQQNTTHRAIVAAGPDTIRGAIELKRTAPNVDIRFNVDKLVTRDVSYVVVDDRDVLLGVGRDEDRVSYNVKGLALASILRSDFENLWRKSKCLEEYVRQFFDELLSQGEEQNALDLVGFRDKGVFYSWIENLRRTTDGETGE